MAHAQSAFANAFTAAELATAKARLLAHRERRERAYASAPLAGPADWDVITDEQAAAAKARLLAHRARRAA